MNKKLSFNHDVNSYDKWRTQYCAELFEKIFEYGKIDCNSKVVEVGCGTGQATEPFLMKRCELFAIECGYNMAIHVKEKFRDYSNFHINHCLFEEYPIDKESINLVFSGTAFHWVKQEVGYQKVYDSLKKNGTIALFWNKPFVNRKDAPVHVAIQIVYKKYRPSEAEPIENDEKVYEQRRNTILKYGFHNLQFYLYHQIRKFNADEYICLLNTYSDHITMETSQKRKFEEEIRDAINKFGGIVNVYDTIDLYLARK